MIRHVNFLIMVALAIGIFIFLLLLTPVHPLDSQPKKKVGSISLNPVLVPIFEDKTLDYGVSFVHQQGEEMLGAIDDVLGPGACAVDFDQDGWVDLFLVNGSGQTRYYGKPYWWQGRDGNALLRNVDGKHFEDVTQAAGLSGSSDGMGCVSADFDNDGDADLLVTNVGSNLFYRNNGDGTFTDITLDSGITGTHWSTSATVADFDRDGLLDIYIANYVNFKKGAHTYEPSSQFSGDMPISFQGSYYEPQAKLLYRNLGNLKFADVTAQMNAANPEGRTLGVAWGDLNNDGWPDLLLANDKGVASNTALINEKGKAFSIGNVSYGINSSSGHRGISLGDIDNDQQMDMVFSSDRTASPLILMNTADPSKRYADKARDMGVDAEYFAGLSGWTPGLHDFNNDGWLDLFMANGLLIPDQDVGRVPLGQPKQLWVNTGKHQFKEVSRETGVALSDAQSARGAVFADFDNDGDIDVYVAHNNDLGQLLINQSPPGNHWLGLVLQATAGNREAIGSRIAVATESGTQTRWVTAGNGFLSDSDRRIHFGLGKSDSAKHVEIHWPDGSAMELRDLPANRYYRIRQGGEAAPINLAASPATEKAPTLKLAVGENDPLNRIAYLQLLASVSGMEAALPELEAGAADADPAVREAVVDLLARYKTPQALRLLTHRLVDPASTVAVKAVDALCAYEDEASVRWMLRAFNSPEESVRVKLAECFGYFYQEEEAVIHRKYLALPYLIKLLDDPKPSVQIAAAKALANAERYRAVQPLMNKLTEDNLEVRAEAIRALGLIREGKAMPAILATLQSPAQSPAVYAHALIALKRLAIPGFATIQHDFVLATGHFEEIAAENRLDAVRFVLADKDDGIVLNQDELADLVINWAKQALPDILKEGHEETADKLISVLQPNPRPETVDVLQALKNHENPAVRANALVALAVQGQKSQYQSINAGLADPVVQVRLSMLTALDKMERIENLPEKPLLHSLDSPETRLAAIKVLSRVDTKESTARLLSIATNPTESPETVEAALTALSKHKSTPVELPDSLFAHPEPLVRKAAFLFWASRQPGFMATEQLPERFTAALEDKDDPIQLAACQALLDRHEAWAVREVENRLAEPKTSAVIRVCLLERHKVSLDSPAGLQLKKLAMSKADPLLSQWLENLLDSPDPATEKFAWQLLQDKSEGPRIRMIAAKSLASRHGPEVLQRLRGQ